MKLTKFIAVPCAAIFLATVNFADAQQAVTSLVLVNSSSDQDIQTITEGSTIDIRDLPNGNSNLNVRAETNPATVGSVLFSGTIASRTESAAPYTLFGDSDGNYNDGTIPLGSHSIIATPYTSSGANGTAGTSLTVNFTLVDGNGGGGEPDPDPDPAPGDPEPSAALNTTSAGIYGELKKWHRVTIAFEGPNSGEDQTPNPFTNYRLNVTFSHPESGKTYLVPGYYAADGNAGDTGATDGNIWRVHFAPDEEGLWNYSVSFREGDNIHASSDPDAGTPVSFDGGTGSFQIEPTDKRGRDFRGKGRLSYVGNKYLQFEETGDYFLKVGADAPENFLAYEDFDGPFKTDGQKDNLVKNWDAHEQDWKEGDPTWGGDGRGKGIIGAINYLASEQMNVFSFIPMNIAGDDRNVFPYLNYNERMRMDCSRLDQWEVVFAHGTALGMYLHFKTQETENETLLDNGDLGVERKLYYRELIARYSHHLALNWNLGEENGTQPKPIDQTTEQRQAMAQYFHDHDPYNHLIVIHNGRDPNDLLGDKSELAGFSLQTNNPAFINVHKRVLQWVNKSRDADKLWVVATDEPGDASKALAPDPPYIDQNNQSLIDEVNLSQENARKNALYGTLFAGGAGVEWYFGYQYPQSDLSCQDWRSRDRFWDVCRIALHFFRDHLPFYGMRNSNELVGNNDDSNTTYCFAREDEVYAVYFHNASVNIDLNLTDATGEFEVRWFDPRNGGFLQSGSVTSVSGGGSVSLGNPPADADQDWIALVRRPPNYKVLYLYGYVTKEGVFYPDGNIPEDAPPPFHQMRLYVDGIPGALDFTQFREALEEVGFDLEERYDASVDLADPDFLGDYKVIILGSNQHRFTQAEADAVAEWVKQGGGLVAWSDSAMGGLFSEPNVGIGNTKGLDSNNDLTAQFGMEFLPDRGGGVFTVSAWDEAHFINDYQVISDAGQDIGVEFEGEGVSPIIVTEPAIRLASVPKGATTPQEAAVCYAEIGRGRVLGTFDRNTFWNTGGPGTDITKKDNREFTQRIILWVAGFGGNSQVLTALHDEISSAFPETYGNPDFLEFWDPLGNGDSDIWNHLTEWVLGLNLGETEPSSIIRIDTQTGSGNPFRLRYQQADSHPGASLSFETSETLTPGDWLILDESPVSDGIGDGFSYLSLPMPNPIGEGGFVGARMNVSYHVE